MTAKIKNCTYAAVLTIVAALCLMLGACADKGGSGARATKVGEVSVLGAGGYGAVFDGQIDPFAPDCFGAICDMGSCYFSFDRGESWTRHDLKGTLHCLEYDPSAEGVVWAAGSGVFKSEDHGRTMRMVFPKQAEVASAGNNYENVNYWIYTDGASDYAPQYQIWSMAIDRSSEGKNVFVGQRVPAAGFGYAQSIRIYRTANGEDFSLFGEYDYSYNFKLDFDESRDCLVLVTERGIYEINMDGEIEFSLEMPVVVQHSSGNTMSFDSFYDARTGKNTFAFSTPTEREHIAAACYKTDDLRDRAAFVDLTEKLCLLTADETVGDGLGSQNSGRMSYEYCEWINGGLNGRNGFVPQSFDWTISFVSVLGDVVYMFHEAETPTYGTDGNGAKFAHVVRRTSAYLRYDGSTDTFDWVYGFPHKPRGEYIENTTWQDADMGFCFGMSGSPSEEKALLFSNIVGLYYTADGQNFRQLNSLFRGADELTFTAGDGTSEKKSLQRLSSTGVDVICTHTVVPDPFDRDHLLVCSTDIGLVQSYDGGSSFYRSLHEWQSGKLVNIDYATYTNTCFDAHFDEKRRGVVYGIWSQAKSAPYEPGTGYLNGDSRFGVSYDGGLSWQMKKITPTGKCLPYRMQVVYEGDERAIYIATDGHGFFVTRDLGDTFTAMNDGIEPAASGGVSAIWGNELLVCDMGIFAVTGGVASSEDNGKMLYEWDESSKRFKKLGLPQAVSEYDGKTYTPAAIRDIVYDKKENCLYLACVANVATNYASISYVAGGIWKYKDGAFTQIYDHTRSVASLATDGEGRLYAIEPNGKLIRFADPSSPPETLLDGLFHKLKTVCMGADDRTLFIASWGGGTYKITLTEK